MKQKTLKILGILIIVFALALCYWMKLLGGLYDILSFSNIMQSLWGTNPLVSIFALNELLGILGMLIVGCFTFMLAPSVEFGGKKFSYIVIATFVLSAIGVLSLLPCVIEPTESLCGVPSVLYMKIASPIFVILALASGLAAKKKTYSIGAIFIFVIFGLAVFASVQIFGVKNFSDCQNVKDPDRRQNCILNFAQFEGNAQYCQSVDDNDLQQLCIQQAQFR